MSDEYEYADEGSILEDDEDVIEEESEHNSESENESEAESQKGKKKEKLKIKKDDESQAEESEEISSEEESEKSSSDNESDTSSSNTNSSESDDDNKSIKSKKSKKKSQKSSKKIDLIDDNSDGDEKKTTLIKKPCIGIISKTNIGMVKPELYPTVIKESYTTKFMTYYEYISVISARANMLNMGAKPLLNDIKGQSPKDIAIEELKQKVMPLYVIRLLHNGMVDVKDVNELDTTNVLK